MLEEVCVKNGWGAPVYELHETVIYDTKLYIYRVCASFTVNSALSPNCKKKKKKTLQGGLV